MPKKIISNLKADILIIDDTPDNLRLLNQILSQHYKVRLAPNGDSGLKAARSVPPDLILLDVMMSGMDGYEVAAQLKADELTAKIPIIFISALDNIESKILGFTAGGVDYITKPFQEQEVLARVHTHLSLRALYKQIQVELNERKRVEEELRESELHYRALVEGIPGIVYSFSSKHGGVYYSSHVIEILGYSPKQLYDQPMLWHDSIHPDDLPRVDQSIRDAANGQAFHLEYRISDAHGNWHWFDDRSIGYKVDDADVVIGGLALDITEHKRAESALRESKELFSLFIHYSPIYTYIKSVTPAESRTLYASDNFQDMIGIPSSEMIGKTMHEMFPPEFAEKITADDWTVVSKGNVLKLDEELNGRSYNTIKFPIVLGDKTFLAGYTIDITERKQAEEHIRQLSHAVEASPTSIVITDTKGDIQYVNPKFTEVTGYSFSEAIGKNPRILKSGQTPLEIHKELWETIPKGKEWHGEFCNRKKNGGLYWESASISPITDGNGVITHYVAVKEDITERKQMEETLRESQSLYHSLVEVSPLSICRKDMEGRFTFANRRFLELSQTTLADLVGKTDYELHPSELAEKYRRDDQAVIDSGQVQELIEERAVVGGDTVVVQSIKTPIYDGAGRVTGIQISFWDITERKRMEDALLLANEELNRQMAEIEKLQFTLQEQAIRDSLTGLYNRRYMEEALTREYARAARKNESLSIVMIDLDGLKKFNDTYGHDVGDQAIKTFADQLKLMTRKEDIACRYGGDEFLVILYNTDIENASKRVEEWHTKVNNVSIPYQSGSLHIAFSAGVATYPTHGENIEEIVKAADEALYRQKGAG